MSLQSILELSSSKDSVTKQGLSEERLAAQVPHLRTLIAFYRQYPDLLVDSMTGFAQAQEEGTLKDYKGFRFYFYQRVFIRVVMRHRFVYATFPRAYSKSFLSMMVLMLRCILYPGSQLFVTTGGKEQAASITIAKIEEICKLIPAFQNEINFERGVSKKSKNDVKYIFKNGSSIDILAARESSRGQRRTGGLMEECVLIDQTALNEIIIPTTNVNRLLPDGTRNNHEVVNKSQIYITTAGWKNSFAYDKLIELLIQSLIDPDEVMIMGGTFETPITEGLLDEDFVDQLKLSGTYNEDSFDREYRSVWSGDAENAFFSSDNFDKHRVLLQPEYEFSGRSAKSAYYVLGVDVGRYKCTTEVAVFKVTPQPTGASLKSLVNLYSYEAEHFEDQAINIKRLYYKYKARIIAIDANGVGAGLVDFMVKGQIDPETGMELPPFGVEGGTADDAIEPYRKIKGPGVENDALFLIKANAPINTEMYSYTKVQMMSGKVKLLQDEVSAKTKLMGTKMGQGMSTDQRNEYLMPFILTTSLKNQMLNLVEENEGVNINLKQSSKSIPKDRFSAYIYGLYYIKLDDERKGRKKKFNIGDLMFMN